MANVCVSQARSGQIWLGTIFNNLDVDIEYTQLGTGFEKREWGSVFESLPLEKFPDNKVVFLHRDPRSVLVSCFHEMINRQMPVMDKEKFTYLQSRDRIPSSNISTFSRSKRFGIERICRFNIWCLENLSNPFVISYEDLLSDTSLQIVRALRFLDLSRSASEIGLAIEHSTFRVMRDMEQNGVLYANNRIVETPDNTQKFLVREGGFDNWRNHMNDESNAITNEYLEKSNYFSEIERLTKS